MIGRDLKLLVTVLRTEGLREVLHRLAFRFLHAHTFTVYRLRLSNALPAGRIPPGVELKEVTREQLGELRKGRTDLPEYFYRDETETLERCWAGLADGRLGFVTWVSYHGSSRLVRIGPQEVELAYIYCLKELRGKRLTTNAVLVIARQLSEEGFTSMLAVPDSDNPAIVKSFLACGFVRIGSIRRFGFVTWPRTPVDYSTTADPVDNLDVSRQG
jgi:RimJ/RimL family protein N-acetyltransferase